MAHILKGTFCAHFILLNITIKRYKEFDNSYSCPAVVDCMFNRRFIIASQNAKTPAHISIDPMHAGQVDGRRPAG